MGTPLPRRSGSLRLVGVIAATALLVLVAVAVLGWVRGDGSQQARESLLATWLILAASTRPRNVFELVLLVIGAFVLIRYVVRRPRKRIGDRLPEADAALRTACDQLHSDSPQTRIAGVRALAAVADTYGGIYRQCAVEDLCEYLYDGPAEQNAPHGADPQYANVHGDEGDDAVKSVILAVLAEHVRQRWATAQGAGPVDDHLWSGCYFDIVGAAFREDVDFSAARFSGRFDSGTVQFGAAARFHDVRFGGPTHFTGAVFSGAADFRSTGFDDIAHFEDAIFHDVADFTGATFNDSTSFDTAVFLHQAGFNGATFNGSTTFEGAVFSIDSNEALKTFGAFGTLEIDHETGLPPGARWGRFDGTGRLLTYVDRHGYPIAGAPVEE